ncbi:MAG: beta-eliminating lyase-related protein [Vicinamibacterales bacterium]
MSALTRRSFVETLGVTAGLGGLAAAAPAATSTTGAPGDAAGDRTVHLGGDGIGLSPVAYASLLNRLTSAREVGEDTYLLGGEIEAFEKEWAALLGKETAVFMPSGTLANHLALRALAGSRRRVIVPEMSHIYNDTGDACQTLSALTLLPLAPGAATFTVADVEAVLARTAGGRVATGVGAIAIESPIRRLSGQLFDWAEAQRIAAFARERGIGTHLDGARLFIASAYTGIAPRDYAAPFDTVYVSLWKYFNAGQGAILAGPRSVLDGLFHVRRMFGGNLAVGWPAAVVARHYMAGFLDRLKAAVAVSEGLYAGLANHPKVAIARIPDGTNLTRLTLRADGAAVVRRLAEAGIRMPAPSPQGIVTLGVNETWTRRSAPELVKAFEQALA